MHTSFYDPVKMRPSKLGIEYLDTIFANALGDDDCEAMKTTFSRGNLSAPYHSINTDVSKRIRYL